MISNKLIRNTCAVLSVISFVGLLLLYFCPKVSLNKNTLEFSKNLLFSIFGSTFVSGFASHIYMIDQLKEIHFSIALKFRQACSILNNPTNNHMLHDYPSEIVKANYEKVYGLINDTYFIMIDFQLKNKNLLPMKTVDKNISTLSIINDICNANYILLELQKEMSSTNPDDGKISELWRKLCPLVHTANDNLRTYYKKLYGKKIAETIDFSSIYRLDN